MNRNGGLTPWARDAMAAAGLTESDVILPRGWRLHGSAASSRGPWVFALLCSDPKVSPFARQTTVYRIEQVRDAISGLVASVTPDLETQLANSLAVLEAGKR